MRERIKAIRKHAGVTQAEFATSLGLGPYGTANWEKKDAQIPTESMQLLICKTYGINKHWLETGEGEMLVSTHDSLIDRLVSQHNLTAMDRGILEAFVQLDDDQRQSFLRVARQLLDAGDLAAAYDSASAVRANAQPEAANE